MPVTYNAQDAVTAWDEGEYEAVLINVEDTTSKSSGKPMQVWTWEVYHPDGRKQEIKDYVVIPAATFKIKQLAQALGKDKEFAAGTFQADDNINCNVTAVLTIDKQEGYDDKNKVGRVKSLARASTPSRQTAPRTIGEGVRQKIANRPAPVSPISEEPVFKDDSIPF